MARESLKSVARLVNLANTREPIEEQFRKDLIRSIEIDMNKPGRPASQTFKPSSMQCMRNSYYQLVGQKPDAGSSQAYNMRGIVNSGSDIHVRLQTAIIRMQNTMDVKWVDVEKFIKSHRLEDLEVKAHTDTETKLYNKKYNISFMCDGIIEYHGKYYIIEIKTETSTKWYSRDGVDKKHYNQAISYSLNFGIDDVIFIYVDRDMLQIKTFMFSVADDMRQSMIDYITETTGYAERHIVPPKPDVEKRVCNYCDYASQCKRDK